MDTRETDLRSKYASAFMRAMRPKKWNDLVYIDLLAGPGRGIDRRGNEFDGSPLIALAIKPPFDQLFLRFRTVEHRCASEKNSIARSLSRTFPVGDCNLLAAKIARQLSNKTLGLAFIDPEGFEVKFTLLRELRD